MASSMFTRYPIVIWLLGGDCVRLGQSIEKRSSWELWGWFALLKTTLCKKGGTLPLTAHMLSILRAIRRLISVNHFSIASYPHLVLTAFIFFAYYFNRLLQFTCPSHLVFLGNRSSLPCHDAPSPFTIRFFSHGEKSDSNEKLLSLLCTNLLWRNFLGSRIALHI